MTVNSAGFQQVMDGGNPRIITAYAKQYISGGQFVFASGADNVVSSGTNSYVGADIEVASAASGAQFIGIATHNAASGAPIAVATAGVYIVTANGAVTASFPQAVDGNDSIANAGSATMDSGFLGRRIGRALTSAASGGHALLYI